MNRDKHEMEQIHILWSSDPDMTVDAQLISVCSNAESANHALWLNGDSGFIEVRNVSTYKREKAGES